MIQHELRQEIPLTVEELELLKACDGKHDKLEELFNCESCDLLLREEN